MTVDPDLYGDRSALGRMASGPTTPEPVLPRTASELDPAPPNPGPCPCCGQPRANLVNTFATGERGAVPVPVRAPGPDDEPDPSQFTHLQKG